MRQTFLVGASLCVILLDFRWKTKKIKTHFNVGGVIPIFMILILLDKIWVQYTYELDPIQYRHIISLEKCLDCIKSDTHTPIYIYIYIYMYACIYIKKKKKKKSPMHIPSFTWKSHILGSVFLWFMLFHVLSHSNSVTSATTQNQWELGEYTCQTEIWGKSTFGWSIDVPFNRPVIRI